MRAIQKPTQLEPLDETVLVTGGSGFAGSWIIVDLLRRGYRVRTTVRDLARESDVRAMVAGQVDPGERLSFFAADLLRDDGWDRAIAGAKYVLHVASPMPIGEFRGQDVVRPAREGTRRVLEASLQAGVKRVVVTSSSSTVMPKKRAGVTADETTWTDLPDKPIYNYPRAKTLAEKDAWAFAKAHPALEVVSVLPSQIQGPVLGNDFSASVDLVGMMLRGKLPALPRVGYGIVDVRDLADLHIRAMISPAAAGERFLGSGEFMWFSDIARILKENLGERASKVRTGEIPDVVVRFGGWFNPEMAQLAPIVGVRTAVTSAKAERILGWRPRSAKASILDGARSLIDRGLA